MQLQVWAGPSPHQLQPASQVYDVQATDALQTFALDPQAPAARYVQTQTKPPAAEGQRRKAPDEWCSARLFELSAYHSAGWQVTAGVH